MQINFGGTEKEHGSLWEVSHGVTSTNARGSMSCTRQTTLAGELTARRNVSVACGLILTLQGLCPFLRVSHLLTGGRLLFPRPLLMPAKTQVPTRVKLSHLASFWRYLFGPSRYRRSLKNPLSLNTQHLEVRDDREVTCPRRDE